jgi:hypothetical protein
MDEEKTNQEFDKTEYEELKEDVQLKAIIAGSKAKKVTVNISGIDIAIRAAIPKSLRDKLVMIAKAYQNEDVESGDEDMYVVLAAICLEPPYTKPAAWKLIDEETGEAPTVLRQIIEKIAGLEAGAKRFR